jgi:hypothetical protein
MELCPDVIDLIWGKALFDDAAHECCELRFLPAFAIAKLSMNEVEPLEWMVVDDSPEEMSLALFACMSLNGSGLVDDVKFIPIGGNGYLFCRYDTDYREQGIFWFIALGATTEMVMGDVSGQRHFDFLGRAVTVKFSSFKAWIAFGDTVVDGGVDGRHNELKNLC